MLDERPTIVLLPFPLAIGAFHPLDRLGLAAGCRGRRLILFGIWFDWVWIVVVIFSILSSSSSFCVRRTGIGRGAVESPWTLQDGPSRRAWAKHSLQVVHFSNIMVGGKVEYNSLRSTPWLQCHPSRAQMIISVQPPPYLEKRKCVSNTNNSTVASCLHIDTRRIIE